jgi:cytidylate kinase
VFPAAHAKFFLTASDRERAKRRLAELGQGADFETVLREIQERDHRDASRDVAPMIPADDALLVDSSTQTLEEVVESLAGYVASRAAAI